MNAKEFVELTVETFDSLCDLYSIKDKDKYFEPTDFNEKSIFLREDKLNLKDKDSMDFVFAQFVFHLQNSSRGIGAFLNFEENYDLIKECFMDFNLKEVIKQNSEDVYNNLKDKIVTRRIFKENKNNILDLVYKSKVKFNIKEIISKIESSKSTEDLKNIITGVKGLDNKIISLKVSNEDVKKTVKGYIEKIFKYAKYLSAFKSKTDLLEKLHSLENGKEPQKALINSLKKAGGLTGIALLCDTVKELDKSFSSYSKPDVHLKRAIDAYIKSDSNRKPLFHDVDYLKVVSDIVEESEVDDMTAYKLDRMIYIIGSNNFFLDEEKIPNNIYLSKIENS